MRIGWKDVQTSAIVVVRLHPTYQLWDNWPFLKGRSFPFVDTLKNLK